MLQIRDQRTAESSERREVRLTQLSDRQHERIAAESIEERQLRLQYTSERVEDIRTSREETSQLYKHHPVQVNIPMCVLHCV